MRSSLLAHSLRAMQSSPVRLTPAGLLLSDQYVSRITERLCRSRETHGDGPGTVAGIQGSDLLTEYTRVLPRRCVMRSGSRSSLKRLIVLLAAS